jgi:serine/threonine protein kinase
MLTGEVPFNGATEYKTLNMIKERDLKFPEGMNEYAKDLIDKLLQKEPRYRLGSGPLNSDNDFDALKRHPFFEGINFESLNSQEIKIDTKPE